MPTYPIRTSTKAIIIRDGKLLVTKNHKNGDEFFLLPGGGQDLNEALDKTLRRECLEEAGAEVRVCELLFVRDFIANNHDYDHVNRDFHQVEFIFSCEILNPNELKAQTVPDDYQTGLEWLPINRLEDFRFFPMDLRPKIMDFHRGKTHPVYLGDIN